MIKTISIIRIAILLALGCVAFIFLFGEEQDESLSAFYLHFIFDKALAAALICHIALLYKRWRKVDPWLKAYDRMCGEVMDQEFN